MRGQTEEAGRAAATFGALGRAVAVFGASGHTGRFGVAELLHRRFSPVAIFLQSLAPKHLRIES